MSVVDDLHRARKPTSAASGWRHTAHCRTWTTPTSRRTTSPPLAITAFLLNHAGRHVVTLGYLRQGGQQIAGCTQTGS